LSRRLFALVAVAVLLVGCHGSPDDAVKPTQWVKPPTLPPAQAQMAAGQQQAGEMARQREQKAAAEMKAAKEKAGIQ
jgi:hypothetical protein